MKSVLKNTNFINPRKTLVLPRSANIRAKKPPSIPKIETPICTIHIDTRKALNFTGIKKWRWKL